MLKSVFIVGFARFFCLEFEDNCVKRIKILGYSLTVSDKNVRQRLCRLLYGYVTLRLCGYSLQFLREETSMGVSKATNFQCRYLTCLLNV